MNRYVILCTFLISEKKNKIEINSVPSTYIIPLGGHTNTERGYLRTLKEKLIQEKSDEALTGLEIIISNKDKHPLQIV